MCLSVKLSVYHSVYTLDCFLKIDLNIILNFSSDLLSIILVVTYTHRYKFYTSKSPQGECFRTFSRFFVLLLFLISLYFLINNPSFLIKFYTDNLRIPLKGNGDGEDFHVYFCNSWKQFSISSWNFVDIFLVLLWRKDAKKLFTASV